MVVAVDGRHRIIYQGAGVRRLLGHDDGSLIGELLVEYLHPDEQGAFLRLMDPLLSEAGLPEAARSVRCRDRSGGWRRLNIVMRRVNGAPVLVLTGRENAESAVLSGSGEDLTADVQQDRADFLAVMSHEIRTPMSGIIGLIDLLKTTEMTTRQQEYVRALVQAGEHLSDLLNDILDFSKIEANRLELETVSFELRKLLGAVMDIFRAKAEAKGLALRGSVAPELSRWWSGDARHLRQVLANLVGNAVKFTDDGHIEVKIAAGDPADHGGLQWLDVSVSDTGIGIAETQKALLFQPFVQADLSSTRRHGGTGLGLAISKKLIDAMGGDISVTSQRHVGSTFRFSVPLRPIEAPQGQSLPSEQSRSFDGRVLVVDDSDLNRLVLGDMLTRFGMTVSIARNGLEALEKVRAEPGFSLIFMDIQMPVMDGFAATEAIRGLETATGAVPTPILALSATAIREDRERALGLGCDDYVVKPLRKEALNTLLRRYCPTDGGRSLSEVEAAGQGTGPDTRSGRSRGVKPELEGKADGEPEANLVEMFLSGIATEIASLRTAVRLGDALALSRVAHTVKGNAMLFGYQDLVDCLRDLEVLGRRVSQRIELPGQTTDLPVECMPLLIRLDRVLADVGKGTVSPPPRN